MNFLTKSEIKDKTGFIFTYSADLRKKISDEEFNNFAKLSSNEEKVKFILNFTSDKPIRKENIVKNKKDLQLALNLKKIGNGHFQSGNWKDALKLYNDSLIATPKENCKFHKLNFKKFPDFQILISSFTKN
jgi:hypothetical protein